MIINVTYPNSYTADEKNAVDNVAAYFQANYTDNITININLAFLNIGNGVLFDDDFLRDPFTYSQLRNALLSHATTADDTTALNNSSGSLPSTDPNPDTSDHYYLTHAQEKALGFRAANDPAIDFDIDISTAFIYDFDRSNGIAPGSVDLIGVLSYEFSRAMGRELIRDAADHAYSLLDALDFKGIGGHLFNGGASEAFLSFNGGANNLGDFASSGNLGDWAVNFGPDAFSTSVPGGTLLPISATDLRELDVLGFTRRVDDVGSTNQFFTPLPLLSATRPLSIVGTVDYSGDHDWYQVQLLAHEHYNFQLGGSDSSLGTLGDPKLTLHDAVGNQIAFDDDSGPGHDSDLYYTPAANMTVFVDVAGFGAATGTYTLAAHFSSTPQTMGADFDNNLHNDILWRNDNGAASIWNDGNINNAHIISAAGDVPNSWHIVNTGDFAGDNRSDILWQNDNGAVSIWDNGDINGGHIIAGAGVVASSWHIAGTGDFDGNGRTDILWHNDNGSLSIWDNGDINHAHIISGPGAIDSSWHIVGVPDQAGAGILWRNTDGTVGISNASLTSPHPEVQIPTSWHIVGTGDFKSDGVPDILWQNDNGAVSIWDDSDVNRGHIIAGPGALPAGWHIAGTGDFDGNGTSDILWHNDNGLVSVWDNGDINKGHIIATGMPADWHIQQHYDIV